MTSLYRMTKDGSLDHQYLRVCAVYRLLIRQRIGKARAINLLAQRKVRAPSAVVEMWLTGHQFRHLHIAA